eukprot:4511530-Prorocentrum_lima.AAC.1
MTSSLVGSEMCIRDSVRSGYGAGRFRDATCVHCLLIGIDVVAAFVLPVSYTHLTLPTICSV